jgi:DNA-binding XRE family transcriptional regulator
MKEPIPVPKLWTISEALRRFRMQHNLTQLMAAKWLLLPPGTYRDYEQGRSEPPPIIAAGIRAKIDEYEELWPDSPELPPGTDIRGGYRARAGRRKRTHRQSITVYIKEDIIREFDPNRCSELGRWIEETFYKYPPEWVNIVFDEPSQRANEDLV